MNKNRIGGAVALIAAIGTMGLSAAANAAGDAPTKVTVEGTGNVFGYVESPKKTCMDGRKVSVYKQKGKKGGSDDKKVASDTADKNGNLYIWDVGNPGIQGKFYAKVSATNGCEGDTSPTVKG